MKIATLFLVLFCFNNSSAQNLRSVGFGNTYNPHISENISPQERQRIHNMLQENIKKLKAEGKLDKKWGDRTHGEARPTSGSFIWPLQNASGLDYLNNYGISNFVDLDTLYPNQLLDWNCGSRTYDSQTGNHHGIDIFTWPFPQHLQENDLVEIISVMDGLIIGIDDGNDDHSCSASTTTQWNAVYIGNSDGTICWYGHMKKNSTINKLVGQSVSAGEVLGIVGSSGASTGPHLHFETHSANGDILEPFSGPCNPASSLWLNQKPYIDPSINAIMTHNHAPVIPDCPQLEIINAKDTFAFRDTLFAATYYHDQTNDNPTFYKIFGPDNSIVKSWDYTSTTTYSIASYRYWYWVLDENLWERGKYVFEVDYEGDTVRHDFWIEPQTNVIRNISKSQKCFTIFPNPNSGCFEIYLKSNFRGREAYLKVTNIAGVELFEKSISEKENRIKINLDLAPGVYIIRISGKGTNSSSLFVIQ